MKVQRFITGDSARLFVNTALGCNSSCSYCYLPIEGYKIGAKPTNLISPNKAIYEIENSALYVPGKDGTVISIGCFSECWDALNRQNTKDIILWALRNNNPVQMATKREVVPDQVKDVCEFIQWEGQFSIFFSSATISKWREYERGTTNPYNRFRNMEKLKGLGVFCYIYIKPVLEDVTIDDGHLYSKIAREHGCDVVIGSRFDDDVLEGESAPISTVSGLRILVSEDEIELARFFVDISKVFWSSIEAINSVR